MNVLHWCRKWRIPLVTLLLLVICNFCKAAPKIMIDVNNSLEDDDTYLNVANSAEYEYDVKDLAPSGNRIPMISERPTEIEHLPTLDIKFSTNKKNGRKRSKPKPSVNRIQLCHFKICNMGRKRAARYYEPSISRRDNQRK